MSPFPQRVATVSEPAAGETQAVPAPSRMPRTFRIAGPDEEALKAIEENNYLAGFGSNVASQGGEDGVIAKILEIMGISEPGWCVEFGACDGKRDSNTWNLVKNHGWKAVYSEPEPGFFTQLKAHCKATPGTYCFNDLVGWEGKNRLDNILSRTLLPKDFEFMVVDIDGPDYYVWEALKKYQPKIVCVEFHRLIHPSVFYVPPKDEATNRPSSLRALYDLAKRKGYELVCVINWNLFFVRKEYFNKFGIKDNRPEAMYYAHEEMRLFQGYDGTLFLGNNDNHYWKYQRDETGVITNIKITHDDIQVLPEGLRIFRPRHTYHSRTLEAQAGKLDPRSSPGNALLHYRSNVTSENGEDGILDYLFKTIGISHPFLVDVGALDGKKWSCSYHLLTKEKWNGLLIERDSEMFAKLAETYKDKENVKCFHAALQDSPETFETFLKQNDVPDNFDLLRIDVEGNDYHLFASFATYVPAVVVIAFNPSVSNDVIFVQENDPKAHYGASLRALVELANSRQYDLVAVTDWNAIFVRRDLSPKLKLSNSSLDKMYIPPFEMRMFQTLDGCTHLTGNRVLMRQDYTIAWEDFQVLPNQLRGRDNSAEHFGEMQTVFYP